LSNKDKSLLLMLTSTTEHRRWHCFYSHIWASDKSWGSCLLL